MTRTAIITADIELSNFPGEQGLWGRIGAESWGLPRLLDELRDLGVPATMFVDVYGAASTARAAQEQACLLIKEYGQDLQLHTHPGLAFDPKREQLRDYSFDEQLQIVAFGRDRIRQWTGVEASVHRAGDWAANADTLRALHELDFAADFSASAWSRSCGIPGAAHMGNGWQLIEGMLCAAGTCYRDRLTGRVRRMDLGGVSMAEIRDCIRGAIDPLILTPHSFSLMRFNQARTRFRPDFDYVRRLRRYVRLVQEAGYRFLPASEAAADARAKLERHPAMQPLPVSSLPASISGVAKSLAERARARLA